MLLEKYNDGFKLSVIVFFPILKWTKKTATAVTAMVGR